VKTVALKSAVSYYFATYQIANESMVALPILELIVFVLHYPIKPGRKNGDLYNDDCDRMMEKPGWSPE
jgi:hypothetical protein